ncbi:sulfatase-like hydrolase/transferase [Luteimicrobium xylanilyticum]|uniref:N-sulfoglucosamine sulfohydrolase n=1 Tax=Luteimicrobium xylanilyticum TaxID=1133546 RepID=A0A5P9QBH8_9MICO|nr:sulfatase-like hydrolase/transferase [Luteimicrobium xylanilyticum]QFU98787.1 N-sulfoglucosamine sulfohydrolase [Luteimicrobium xylanilyticum]
MSGPRAHHPSVLVLLSDDQGPWALGCAGNEEIITPTLDGLAAEGTRLENFFCVSPVCSPARASLLSGTIPSVHGVHDYLAGQDSGPGAPPYLADVPLVTESFAEAGYRVGLSGKWHLGTSDVPGPGFTHWFALEGGGSPYHDATFFRVSEKTGLAERVHVTDYVTDVIADDAIEFVRTQPDDRPFFLQVGFTAPHKPFAGQHPARFEDLYADCAFATCPQEPLHPWTPLVDGVPIGGERDTRAALVGYFAAVTAMDEAIGRILGALAESGRAEDTVVVFMSDNGFSCGHHGIWGKGNGTYPQNMYDSSVKVPAIFHLPGRVERGQVLTELLSGYDVAATLLELAGLPHSPFESGPGRSFAQLLTGGAPAEPDREVVVHDEYGPVRMIRTDTWKYVHRHPSGPHELYDLAADPGERSNLVDDPVRAATVAQLRDRLARWFGRHVRGAADGAGLPVVGAGQLRPLADDPQDAFAPPGWDSIAG